MQILPSPILSSIVKHFLIIENENAGLLRHRMFSDGNTGLVFNYGDDLLREESAFETKQILPRSFVYGQLDTFQTIISTGKIGMMIVVFQPFGATALFGTPAVELKNLIIDTDFLFPTKRELLVERIFEICDHLVKIKIVEDFLSKKLLNRPDVSLLTENAVHLIHRCNGNMPVVRLASLLQTTERQLQRNFELNIGLSPKRFSGITKVQYFLKLVRKNQSGLPLTNLVYDAGFYDQAHLIREMKNISGLTPGQYAGQKKFLAANFLPLPE